MNFLTAQEQKVLAIVLILLLVGMTVKVYRGSAPDKPEEPSDSAAPGK